jgi:hypothetical protein
MSNYNPPTGTTSDFEVPVPTLPAERYTEAELHAAFDLVKNRNNWKMPVRGRLIPTEMTAIVAEALIYFCGSPCEIVEDPSRPGHSRVYAAGYYACVGA